MAGDTPGMISCSNTPPVVGFVESDRNIAFTAHSTEKSKLSRKRNEELKVNKFLIHKRIFRKSSDKITVLIEAKKRSIQERKENICRKRSPLDVAVGISDLESDVVLAHVNGELEMPVVADVTQEQSKMMDMGFTNLEDAKKQSNFEACNPLQQTEMAEGMVEEDVSSDGSESEDDENAGDVAVISSNSCDGDDGMVTGNERIDDPDGDTLVADYNSKNAWTRK
ncbi:hypothetical protein L1887_02073 [Cichorium endivia]|nr:hypothetical protein L1887_02073 [Cichorium endivia]